jgi:hypothetical protein
MKDKPKFSAKTSLTPEKACSKFPNRMIFNKGKTRLELYTESGDLDGIYFPTSVFAPSGSAWFFVEEE